MQKQNDAQGFSLGTHRSEEGARRTPNGAMLLTQASGAAKGLFRLRHTVPSLSMAAFLSAAVLSTPSFAMSSDAGSEPSSESGGEGSCEGGGCNAEDDGTTDQEGVDSGDSEVCQDEPECPCDSGEGETGVQGEQTGPSSLDPVAWDTGEKWEQVSDLYVKMKGKDFQLTRQYTSDPDFFGDLYGHRVPATNGFGDSVPGVSSNPSLGLGWAFSNLRSISYREHWACEERFPVVECEEGVPPNTTTYNWEQGAFKGATAWLARPGRKPRAFDIPSSAITGYSTGDFDDYGGASVSNAPGNQGVVVNPTSRQLTVSASCGVPCQGSFKIPTGIISGTVTFQEPGQWEQEFSISGGVGWISHESDEYGNTRDYVDNAGVGVSGMPDTIYLNGEYNSGTDTWENYEARVELYWESFDFDPGAGTDTEPLLVRAEVWRPTSSGDMNTQFVEYYHLDTSGGGDGVIKYLSKTAGAGGSGTYQALDTPGTSTDLEAAGDLGTHGDLVQVARYTAVDPDDSSTDWRTEVSQYRYHDYALSAPTTGDIRLRIEGDDHQLKMVFHPQQLEHIAQQRLGGGTPDDMTVVEEASKLLAIEDDGEVDSTNSIDMYEVAAKIVSYDLGHTDYPVDRQFLQATSCGCGGGSTTAVLRTYTQVDGWEATVDATTVDGESMHMREYKVTSFASDPTVLDSNIYRIFAFDMILLGDDEDKPYLWTKAVIEGDQAITERGGNPASDDPRAWVTRKLYDVDDRAVTGKLYPSFFSGYTLAATGMPPSAPSVTGVSDGGYAESYSYDVAADNENVTELAVYSKSGGSTTSPAKVSSTVYMDEAGKEYRDFLPETRTRYRSDTGADNLEVVSYEYGFDSTDSAKLNWRAVTIERESSNENGHATEDSATWYEFYDDAGKLIWEVDPDGTLTRYEYDFNTGVLVKVVRNSEHPDDLTLPGSSEDPLYATLDELETLDADSSTNAPFPTSASVTGSPLATAYEVDLLGRRTEILRPGGVKSYIVREMREDSLRPGILYYAKVGLPHELASSEFDGPATVRWYDADYAMTRSSSYELDIAGSDYAYASNTYELDTELSRTASVHDLSGSATKRRTWWELGETHETYYETQLDYDAHGRLIEITDAEGTVTEQVHDAYNRVIERRVGTTGSTPVTVAEYFYDGDPAATTPDQGVGNGNVTAIALYDGESADARISRMYYDGRDRLIASVVPDSAMTLTRYDNLNRPIEEAAYPQYDSVSGPPDWADVLDIVSDITTYMKLPITNSGLNLPSGGERSWHSLTDYSQRGLVWRRRTAIDPGSSSTTNYLDWLSWYDAEGNELASWAPNSPMSVYEYDEHDRVSKVYVSDRATEAGGSLTHANATSVSGDAVLQQGEFTYDDSSGGVIELVESKMRVHDATATGELTDADSITSYIGYIYDDALRQIATVNFGTNKSDFSDGTSTAPTLSSYDTLSKLRSATDVLFSWQEYNSRGLVDQVVAIQSGTSASDEIRTKYLYDDLYRAFAVIENYDNATLSWDATEGRYAASGLDYTDLSEDRVTSFVHDEVGKVTKRVVHIPADPSGEDVQVTEYVYGVSSGSSSNVMDSLVASNNLLSRVKYPDESTGEAGASTKYYVDYAFNRLGELRGVTDQNRTIRQFERDERGRVTADIVDTIATHTGTNARNIDGTIKRLSYRYDDLGRMVGATSHTTSASSGNIRDEVEIGYTPLWQVEKIYQQHDGVVNTSTSPTVEYVYDNAAASGATGNYSRIEYINYPTDVAQINPRNTVGHVYGDGTIDDRISRVSTLQVNGLNYANTSGTPDMADLISYERIGLGVTAKATVGVGASGWDVVLDRTVNHDGSSTSGAYPSFDRFGRIKSHMWVRDDFDTYISDHPSYTGSYTGANQPAYLEVTHTYDRSSNRLTYSDNRQGAKLPGRVRTFDYDRLNRLTEEVRTPVPSGSTYTPQHSSKQWHLDTLGNWASVDTDSDNDGDFDDGSDLDHELVREHNMANEIESGLQYDARIYESATTTMYLDRIYDDNGNMTDELADTSLPSMGTLMPGQRHTYDAWNRLVKTQYVPSSGSSTDVSVNTYNALGWRTSRSFDDSTGAYDGLDQKRVYSYGADWRMLEERVDTDVSTDSDSEGGADDDTDWIGQQFWGLRYIDDAVGKRVDRAGDGDFLDTTDCTYWYQLTDTQFSVCVVLDYLGVVYERIDYDAYGRANHRYAADANGDNSVSSADTALPNGDNTIDLSGYHADLDVNCDGTFDNVDVALFIGYTPYVPFAFTGLPEGWLSDPSSSDGPDNSIGYAGYVYNHEREDYTVRFRNYNPELGRWMQRDPIGYRGGVNLYGYVKSQPMNYVDTMGLEPEPRDPRSQEQREKDVCDALKAGIEGGLSLSEFVQKHSDGTSVGKFNQTHMDVPWNLLTHPSEYKPRSEYFTDEDWRFANGFSPMVDVDLDWAIVIAWHNNGGMLGYIASDGVIYSLGKTFWVFAQSDFFFDGFVDIFRRYHNKGESNAVRLASRLHSGAITLSMLYDALGCEKISGIACPPKENSGTESDSGSSEDGP